MSYSDTMSITAFLSNNISIDFPDLTIGYDNVEVDPKTEDEFVIINILPNASRQIECGNTSAFRFEGIVYIRIFVKKDVGVGRINTLIDTISGYTRYKTLNNIKFKAESIINAENKNGWYNKNIQIPYAYEKIYNYQ